MRVLESWLKKYVKFSIPPEELTERLTMLGLEFEGVERLGEKYRGFVVGKVLARDKHPHADRLSVCIVDVGKETLSIVCGAPNVAVGQKVAVGLVGAVVPGNQHKPDGKPLTLSRVTIRGVPSFGMICSASELDLGKDADGILVLDEGAKVGESLSSHLGLDDVAYDIEITPNRPDWLSHIGVAREIGLLVRRVPKLTPVRVKEGRTPIREHLSVLVEDPVNCPRFAVRMIRGVRVAPSPPWLQNTLRNAGLRPINNVVDVTNYVMLECGQPMHAFDHALLRGGRIIVRHTKLETPFTTLDGKAHRLPLGTVMVCDSDREVSIAGVMGGANSEISGATTDIVLEAAYWNPSSIRRTAKALGIKSDASQRFERGADPNCIPYALNRAALLVLEVAGGTVLRGVIDVYPKKIKEKLVPLRPERVNHILGTSLTKEQILRYLRQLDIRPGGKKKGLTVYRIPSFRVDVEREIDLIEEVARVHGYNNIEEKTSATVDFVQRFPKPRNADLLRATLIGGGFQEAITNSMQDGMRAALGGAEPVVILNPQSQDMGLLRTSLVPGLLDVIVRNVSHGNDTLRLFEIGHVFSLDHTPKMKLVSHYLEEERLCVLLTGLSGVRHWSVPPRPVDIFDAKGQLEALLTKIALDKWRFISYSTSNGLTDNTLTIEIHGSYAGFLGQIKEGVLKQFGIEQEVYVAELSVASFDKTPAQKFESLPRYPRVRRDVSFFVDDAIPVGRMEQVISEAAGELLERVAVFDIYQGEEVEQGRKSVAFSLELMSREATLTETEIEAVVKRVTESVESTLGGTLRRVK